MNADTRQLRRTMALAQTRPQPPLGVRLAGSRLSWEEPSNRQGITHYLIRVGSDADSPRYKVSVGQNSCVLAGGDSLFWVSSWNETGGIESVKTFCSGTAAGAGAADAIGNVTSFSAAAEDADNGMVRIRLSGTLPTDEMLQGLVFVIESPAEGDLHPDDLTLPGVLQVDCPEWYCNGDGSPFSLSFLREKPASAEKWIVYALAFSAYASNFLKRVTQFSPALPVDATPWSAIDLGDILTLEGSGLGDVTITGTPALTPTGYGTLKIDLKYIPPYLTGPAISIGDFQGVTAFVEYADGSVTAAGDFPYLGNPSADPPDNLGEVSLSIPMPAPQTIYVQLCSYSTTARLPYKPHSTAPSIRWVALTVSSGTVSGGMATQVGAFSVTVLSETLTGVAAGGKQGTYKITYTPPVDSKWREVWIERIACDASYDPLPGASWGGRGVSTGGLELYGPWPWPTTTEYWRFRARSVNQDGVPNDTAYPQVLLSVAGDGAFTLANNAIAGSMLQDLAVTARALADYTITSDKYAPLSIGAAAIGLAAINNANIHDLSIDKLTSAGGSITLTAGGSFAIEGNGGALSVYLDSLGVLLNANTSVMGSFSCGDLMVGALALYTAGGSLYAPAMPFHLWQLDVSVPIGLGSGGTGASTAADARTSLGLGGAALLDVGVGAGTVASGDHNHDLLYAPIFSGASGTFASPTSITVSNGIITSIS